MTLLERIMSLVALDVQAMAASSNEPEKAVEEYLRSLRAELNDARDAAAAAMATETRAKARYETARQENTGGQGSQPQPEREYAEWLDRHEQVSALMSALGQLEAKIASAEEARELLLAQSRRAQNSSASGRSSGNAESSFEIDSSSLHRAQPEEEPGRK